MPASACPGAVPTTTRTCNSGRAQRNPALMRAREHSVSTHELRMMYPFVKTEKVGVLQCMDLLSHYRS
jgi:hypothetical protein